MAQFKIFFQRLKRLTIFDWFAVLAVFLTAVFLILFIFKQERWVRVDVGIFPEEWWRDNRPPPYWLTNSIHRGDKQYDVLGRETAEVIDVKNYQLGGGRTRTDLILNLKTEVDRRKRKLKFNHRPLEVGGPIDLTMGSIGTRGVITYIEGMPDPRVFEEKIVEARLVDRTTVFPETLGVQPWIAEVIKIGDQMRDSQGRVVAEILEKNIKPAEKIIVTSDGRVLVNQDPLKKDVSLVIKLDTLKQGETNYFLGEMKIKVDSVIFLALPKIDIDPVITKVLR